MKLFYFMIVLMISMSFAQNHKVFNTVGFCTLVDDIEYCAVKSVQSIGTFNVGGLYDMALRNPNGNVSFYKQDKDNIKTVINEHNTLVETSLITDKDSNKTYIAVNTKDHLVLVDSQTQCYNKHYFIGNKEEFKNRYSFIEVSIDELSNYIDTCLIQLINGVF